MSRHRNIRNMTDEDYYDYDDYDDDYYEEDDDAYYMEQERVRKLAEKEARQQAVAAKLQRTPTKPVIQPKKSVEFNIKKKKAPVPIPVPAVIPQPSEKEQENKESMVTCMGFSQSSARIALQAQNWNVELAINDLLVNPNPDPNPQPVDGGGGTSSGGDSGGEGMTMTMTMAPPPGMTRPRTKEEMKAPTMSMAPPPPGISKSPSKPKSTPTKSSKSSSTSKSKSTSSSKSKQTLSKASSMKKISPQLQAHLQNQKSRLTMVILGHVDAGKSTLMGQVLVQCGKIEKRTVTKYAKQAGEIGKASFALAWIMDEDESERERGVTIDIATKQISTPRHDLTILDAPGHADYVPAMITGAGVSDVGILVVSSTKGEFESGFDTAKSNANKNNNGGSSGNGNGNGGQKRGHVGQTREHITLARGLGVSQLIVAVNKLDAAEPSWSQARFDEIEARLRPFLKANGFNLDRVQFVPISGLTGANVKVSPRSSSHSNDDADANAAGLASWYKGKTLMGAMDKFQPAKRNIEKPFRFISSDIYAEGKGIVVKGRVAQGVASVGDKVCVLPVGDVATVSRIEHGSVDIGTASSTSASVASEKMDQERRKVAIAGDSVELILAGIDIARITVGNILSDAAPGLRPEMKKKFLAKIIIMEELTVPLIRGSQLLLHMHCLDTPAVISKIISKVDKKNGNIVPNPRVVTGGCTATVEIKLMEKLCVEDFGECRALGRFVLRRSGDTVAVGIIEST